MPGSDVTTISEKVKAVIEVEEGAIEKYYEYEISYESINDIVTQIYAKKTEYVDTEKSIYVTYIYKLKYVTNGIDIFIAKALGSKEDIKYEIIADVFINTVALNISNVITIDMIKSKKPREIYMTVFGLINYFIETLMNKTAESMFKMV